MTSKFSPEIIRAIEKGDLKEANRLAHYEIQQVWIEQEQKKLEVTKKWLH